MPNNEFYTEEQISSICDNIPDLEQLEQLRLLVQLRKRNYIFISFIAGLLLVAGFFVSSDPIFIIIGIIVYLIGIAIFWFVYNQPNLSKLKTQFKEKIIQNYILALIPGAKYSPNGCFPLSSYHQSLLFQERVDRHYGENYVEGVCEKTDVSFSYLHTEYKEVTYTKNGQKTTWVTIFQGVFMRTDSNKNFSGQTFVLPDTAEKIFGRLGKWMQKNSFNQVGKMVYMENVKFEKEFVVYTTDPVEARYLLTPKIQEQILHMKKFLKAPVRMSFVNNHVFIAITRGKIFKMDTSLPFTSNKTLRYYLQDIIELLSLVHILDLNTRIWGKE